MKIKLLVSVLAVFSAVTLKAQTEFAPIGATWYYGIIEAMWGDKGYLKVTSADTTVIDGKKAKVLVSEYHQSDGGVFPRDTIYVYQTGDSVLFYRDGDFHLVYNFGLNVGDTMELYNPDNKICHIYDYMKIRIEDLLYGHVVVKSIDTLNINGTQLKEFKFASIDPKNDYSHFTDHYHYIEKIGTTSTLFGDDCTFDNFGAGIFGDLRCYEDEEVGLYQYGREACDSLYEYDWEAYYRRRDSMLRVDVIDKEYLEVKLFYSQSDKAVVVDTRGSCEQSVIKIFDVDGRIVYCDVCEPDIQTRVALKKKGVYVVLINNNLGTYYEKVIAY
ncbi:MAG: T9SS type A sorting domain-containing protein [Bacteroidales bacterium]|nr:T9SS type A sorting domain-containing protein [Bacteroidales bacterium]